MQHCPEASFLTSADEWVLAHDLQDTLVVPLEISCTARRPDVLIYSPSTKQVLIVELTCPLEDRTESAAMRKTTRYEPLRADALSNGWTCPPVATVEVGSRGFVAPSLRRFLKLLDCSKKTQHVNTCSEIAFRCSYIVYLSRGTPIWPERPLMHTSGRS